MGKLTESLEKYLLAIYELTQNGDSIIVKDVSEYLKVGGASAAEAIKILRDKGYVNYIPYGNINLTKEGADVIELKLYRHNTIAKFLNKVLGIDIDNANKNASAVEYSMTEDVLVKFVHFLDFMSQCSCKEPKWIKSCRYSLKNGEMSDKCKVCKTAGNGCSSCCETYQ